MANEGRLLIQEGFPMLVLSRKNGESVRVGETIEVKVLAIDGSRVKLGFSAPPHVDIQRENSLTFIRASARRGRSAVPWDRRGAA